MGCGIREQNSAAQIEAARRAVAQDLIPSPRPSPPINPPLTLPPNPIFTL